MAVVGLLMVATHHELRGSGYDRDVAAQDFLIASAGNRGVGIVVVPPHPRSADFSIEYADPDISEEQAGKISGPGT